MKEVRNRGSKTKDERGREKGRIILPLSLLWLKGLS